MYMMGWSFGLTLRIGGRARQRLGQLAQRRAIAALHVLGGEVDVPVQRELDGDVGLADRAADELIWSMPGMVENWFSSGAATPEAMVTGSAPGSAALT